MNRYLPDLITAISKDIEAHAKKAHANQALGDHLEFVPLKALFKEDHVLADRIYSLIQKFCDGLALKGRKMKERQQRQKKGLIDILSNKRALTNAR